MSLFGTARNLVCLALGVQAGHHNLSRLTGPRPELAAFSLCATAPCLTDFHRD